MQKITVVVKKPGEKPEVKKIDNTLEAMQELVGGYIECLALSDQLDLWANEESLVKNLPFNTYVRGVALFGTIFVAATNSMGETISLNKNQINKIVNIF